MKKYLKDKIHVIRAAGAAFLFAAVFLLAACGTNDGNFVAGRYYNPDSANGQGDESVQETAGPFGEAAGETEAGGENVPPEPVSTSLFMIMSNDMQSQCLILEQLASGKQYMYYYSIATRFLNKYGGRETVSEFEPGRIITIGEKDEKGRVKEVSLSGEVWEYPDITRYSVDEKRGVIKIADTNYSYDEKLYINSDGNRLKPADLTGGDTLRVVGIGKKILSVSVTTGHGELQLVNTDLFRGSFIQIGEKIFSEITGDMTLEVPEGTYTVAVANKGYGGSTEIEIKRGQKQTLDLDTLKGDGPEHGDILFAIDVAGAVLQIDGETVDYSQAVPLTYGMHSLLVTADNYDPYSKKLFVNSKEATIVIGLTGETYTGTSTSDEKTEGEDGEEESGEEENGEAEEKKEENTAGTGMAGSLAGGSAGSLAGSHSGDGTGSASTEGTDTTKGTSSLGDLDEAELNALVEDILGKKEDEKSSSTSDYLSTLTEFLTALKG